MKNIIKTLALALLLVNVSCENDDQAIISGDANAPQLIAPSADANYVLTAANGSAEAATFVWNHAEYGQQTAVNYELEFAKSGTDFAEPISGGTSANNQKFISYTGSQLNAIATQAGLAPFAEGKLDVRVKSWLGTTGEGTMMYSNIVSITVKPYTDQLPQLAVPGNHQGWSPPTAPRIASSAFGATDYEGYVWLDGEFKFVAPDADGIYDWNHGPDYGDDGSFSGVLAETNETNMSATAGYYRIKADTNALTYSVEPTAWGVIGNATPGGWDNSTPMTYDATTKTWSVVVTLSAQTAPDNGWKFRANNAWAINMGDVAVGQTDGKLTYDGKNIGVATAGTYKIVLDLSNPRNYKYTITAQ